MIFDSPQADSRDWSISAVLTAPILCPWRRRLVQIPDRLAAMSVASRQSGRYVVANTRSDRYHFQRVVAGWFGAPVFLNILGSFGLGHTGQKSPGVAQFRPQ
jgi:hypothetical protein